MSAVERDQVDPETWLRTVGYAYSMGVPLPDSVYAQTLTWQPSDSVPSERVWCTSALATS